MTPSNPPRRLLSTRITPVVLGVALLVALAGCGSEANGQGDRAVVVVDASVDRPANPSLAAIRLTIDNRTATDDVLVGVTSPDGVATIHRSDTDAEGRSTMSPVERLEVPARSSVRFEPGGLHVMLDDISRDLEVGDTVTLQLDLEHHGPLRVEVPVVEPLSTAPGDDDHDHEAMSSQPAALPAGALR